ncbi:MAG: hypothetical protein K0R25_1124 [Rickettsiaceae bacterium]|nr:hypothetical protein [Rickettsiaceae bacterium]
MVGATNSASAKQETYVEGHYRKDGSYVKGHYKTIPDRNIRNNYSTKGNYNPHTGEEGKIDPDQN